MKLSKRSRGLALAGAITALEAAFLKRRTGSFIGFRTVVRCHRGHLFTTTWIPGVSVKSVRLGPRRIQRCPIGHHWSLVKPMRKSELSDDDRANARAHRDTFLP